jgi:hypothetical protein
MNRSIRRALLEWTVFTFALVGATGAHAQTDLQPVRGVDAISLPAGCTLDNPAQRASLSTLTAMSGLIQNLGANPVNLTCALVRTGGLPRVSVSVDVRPGSQPVRIRVVAADTSAGPSIPLVNAGAVSGPPNGRFQRITAAFGQALSDNFGVVLKVTLNQGDTLGRILLRQQPPSSPLQ